MTFESDANDLTDLGTLKAFLGIPDGRVIDGRVTAGGSGYTAAAVAVSGTGLGAAAIAILAAGVVVGIQITNPGRLYRQASTTFQISGDGDGATADPVVEDNIDQAADGALQREISATSNFALRNARLWLSAEETEFYDGDVYARSGPRIGLAAVARFGTLHQSIVLRRWPITAIAEVKTLEGTSWTVVPASDGNGSEGYLFDESILYFVGGARIPRGVQNVSVRYTAGHVRGESYVLSQIENAVLMIAASNWNQRESYGYSSKNLAGEHGTVVTYSNDSLPSKALEILDRFRTPSVA